MCQAPVGNECREGGKPSRSPGRYWQSQAWSLGIWQAGRQPAATLTDWQGQGGRSHRCPQGAHHAGEGCGCGEVEGKHKAEPEGWPHLFAPQVYTAGKGPALDSIHPPSATDLYDLPPSFGLPLCEMGLRQLFLPPVYEMPISGPQPQPVAQR